MNVKTIEFDVQAAKANDLALIDAKDAVWIVVPLKWWDFATWLYWLFVPADRKARVWLTTGDGHRIGCNAVRMAARHVRVRNRIGNA